MDEPKDDDSVADSNIFETSPVKTEKLVVQVQPVKHERLISEEQNTNDNLETFSSANIVLKGVYHSKQTSNISAGTKNRKTSIIS